MCVFLFFLLGFLLIVHELIEWCFASLFFFCLIVLCLMLSLYPSDEAFLIELVLFMSIILCNLIFYDEANYSAFYIRLC